MAMGIYSSTVLATARMREITRGNTVAIAAARTTLALLRAVAFRAVFARFNSDPSDDPGGVGTAPGSTFPVPDLELLPGVDAPVLGTIIFPVVQRGGGENPGFRLSEENQNERLGMPRDLNGDSRIDGDPREDDYRILPIQVLIAWHDRSGDREARVYSTLAGFRW